MSAGSLLATCNVDALISAHTNLTQTKGKSPETGFELQVEFPTAIDIRQRIEQGRLVKRPGAIDAYPLDEFLARTERRGNRFLFPAGR